MRTAMMLSLVGLALTGCTATATMPEAANQPTLGYPYTDANHPGGLAGVSPPAAANAGHNTYLWAPSVNGGERW